MTSARLCITLLLLTMLSACSSTTFLYNRLDFLIPWYLGDYVDLDRAQKQLLKSELQPFLAWHRSEELPDYLGVLDQIDATLAGEVTSEQVAGVAAEFENAWLRIEARALEWMLVLGAELSDEQMAEFLENLREKQQEYEEEYLTRSDEEYVEEAYENLRDAVQDYMGRLDWGQRAILEEAAGQLRRSDSIWLSERAAWLDRLETTLQREEGWQQAMRDTLAARDETTSEEYLAVYEHNSQVIFQALARIANSRTEQQDKKLRGKLDGFREDLETLIEQGRG